MAQRGFSLIEVIIAIAILAILVALAAPSLTSIINANRLSSVSNEFLATAESARMEAVRRNARVVVCKSINADTSSPTCNATAGNWAGWLAYVDDGGGTPANARNNVLNTGEDIVRVNTIPAPVVVQVSPSISGTQTLVFRSDSLSRAAGGGLLEARVQACIVTTTPAMNARVLRIRSGSRMSVTQSNGGGNCTAPPNPLITDP